MAAVGWRFQPSDEFLIAALQRLESGLQVNLSPHLTFLDLYCKEPWMLFSGGENENFEQEVGGAESKYVISRIVRTGGKSNFSRTAGAGTWVYKGKTSQVGEGLKKTDIVYEYWGGDGASAGKGHYYLHEFQIPNFDLVICKVHRDLSKACQIPMKRKSDSDDAAISKPKRRCLPKASGVPAVPEASGVPTAPVICPPVVIDDCPFDAAVICPPVVIDDCPFDAAVICPTVVIDDCPSDAPVVIDDCPSDAAVIYPPVVIDDCPSDAAVICPPVVIDDCEEEDEQEYNSSIFDEILAELDMMEEKEDDPVPQVIDLEDDHPAAEQIEEEQEDDSSLLKLVHQMMDSDDEADVTSASALIWGPDF